MPVAHASLTARPRTSDKTANVLTVEAPGIRSMVVLLNVSNLVEGESNEVEWTLSAWATLAEPLDPAAPNANLLVTLAPSQITLPPLGAPLMHVATAYWPFQPAAASLSVLFSTDGTIPQAKAQAWGISDNTPHGHFGLFAAPFGYSNSGGRIVDPLPTDPEVLQQLQIAGRIPRPLERRRRF